MPYGIVRRASARALIRGVIAALFIVPALAAPAQAQGSYGFDGELFAQSVAASQAVWGATPCGGQVGYAWINAAPEINATSHWSAGETFTDCRIDFNVDAEWSPEKFCTIVVHEHGHLLGQEHVDDPTHVMSAEYTGPMDACRSVVGAGAAAAAAAAPLAESADEPRAYTSKRSSRTTRRKARCVRRSRTTRRCVKWKRVTTSRRLAVRR